MTRPEQIAAKLSKLGASDARHLAALQANATERCALLTEADTLLSDQGTITPTVIEPKK